MATQKQYDLADALARAAMAIRPDLRQDQSLDEWILENSALLTDREKAVAQAALDYHPDHNPDLD